MNRLAVLATFVATIGATLALSSTSAVAAKPAPPPPPDPCMGAQSRGFPGMVFTRQRTTSGHIYYDTILSDLTGQCQKTILIADGFAPSRPGSDVNLRYDPTNGNVLVVRGGGAPGVSLIAYQYTVSFDGSGVPSVLPGDNSIILDLSDPNLQTQDQRLSGWSKYVLANPLISPDGTKLLATVAYQQTQGTVQTVRSTFWTCPFASGQAVAALECQMVFVGSPGGYQTSGWGGRSDSLYITDTSIASGSGRSLYRLALTPLALSEIWSLGTFFSGAKGSLSAGQDLVAVYEAGQSSGCSRVLVINGDSCPIGGCQILNGAGAPARTMTWLPDGSLAGEGQTKPNQKGQCSASGSIVKFAPQDPNSATDMTTVTPSGSQPDGAGGG